MLSRIHVYAASLGLFLAGTAIAVGQSLTAVMPDRATASATQLPSYELMGFPISPHQFSLLGSANIQEQSPSPSLTMAGMPASPHQVAVLTPRPRTTEALPATNPIATVSSSTR
jgi:hypothetical protein